MRKLFAALFTIAICSQAPAADPTYWQDVRPVLRKHCTVCHTERKLDEPDVSAGLALNTPELIRKGGKLPVLKPGKPDESLIVTLLTAKDPKRRMPLDADTLSTDEIAMIRKWVAGGAPEGVKPSEPETTGVNPVARSSTRRKLEVTFATKAALPNGPPLELSLPIGPLPPATAVAFSPDGTRLAISSYGQVVIWDLTAAKPAKVLTNVLAAVNDVKFSPDGTVLAIAGGQPSVRGDLRIFSTKDWKLLHSLGGHADVVSGVSFAPDGSKLTSASFDKTVRLWDLKSAKLLHTYTGHSDFVYAVAFSPAGDWYATASKDRTGRVIDAATGQSRLTFSGMNEEVLAIAVRPDGKQVVTSGFESQLHWWDAATGERIRRQAGHNVAVHELAFDRKGTIVASAGADGTVRVWNPQSGASVRTLPVGPVVYAVGTDGKRIAAGSADGLARVFDAASGRLLVTFWSSGADDWLAVTPDGFFAAADGTKAIGKWSAAGKLVEAARVVALADPAKVAASIRGETVAEPVLR